MPKDVVIDMKEMERERNREYKESQCILKGLFNEILMDIILQIKNVYAFF